MAKGLSKALFKVAKSNKGIAAWQKSITNHLWFCCATCEGSEEKLLELWASLLHHVQNKHEWRNKKTRKIERCQHEQLSENHREWTAWIHDKKELKILTKVSSIVFICCFLQC